MRKLIFILLAFLAVITFIRAFEQAGAYEQSAAEIPVSMEKNVEISR